MPISHGVELGAQKIGKFEVLLYRETVNYIYGPNPAKNTHYIKKSLE